jgi:hypothetical protein
MRRSAALACEIKIDKLEAYACFQRVKSFQVKRYVLRMHKERRCGRTRRCINTASCQPSLFFPTTIILLKSDSKRRWVYGMAAVCVFCCGVGVKTRDNEHMEWWKGLLL